MEQSTKLPTFLIIGVQKAGTTSIYNYLKQHPQVYMSPVKETNFLERDWENLAPEVINKNGIDTLEKYSQLFAGVKDEVAIGEASPNYLFHYESASARILRYLPDAKLIAILRNPIERAYSDYLMHIRDAIGAGKSRTLSEQIKSRSNASFTLRKGLYYEQLKYFFDAFGKEQVKVYLYDDFSKKPLDTIQDLYKFIGVDDTFNPDMSKKSQVAQVPRVQFLNTLLRKQNPLRKFTASVLKNIIPLQVRQNIRSSLIDMNSTGKPSLSTEERQELVKFYREDILKLQDLIHKDLSSWLSI
ncbi:MAG: sulfotransferase [Symploca sp. SIO3C6]|uniref:Sulfotransferase n=1 Tax=Symploca sp. SIO1C4 TaxID=2607765 RepID=A0A6B3N4F2_9CYAN|nr:sulfotransferase [Symploca sp. SIO3C6]NER28576.1 sulfotransferase [Symploca sp. SIO1C4]NET06618.1 sulfotransferase [Symploca sp. SIO2B6]